MPKLRSVLPCWTIVLGSCALPAALEEPKLQVSPYLSLYEITGRTRMQSVDSGSGSVVDNNNIELRDFGSTHHDEDIGVRVDIGDGFSSFRLDFLKLDQNSSRKGMLTDDWGNLQQGDAAHLSSNMDELRVGYVGEIWRGRFGAKEKEVDLRLGIGAVIANRDLRMEAREDVVGRVQSMHAGGRGSLSPAMRARASYRNWYLDGEYAISPEGWSAGGQFDGTQQDLEVRLGYQIPMQDVAVFAGWRWSQFEITGNESGFRHTEDLTLSGFQFGIVVTL